MQEEEGSIPTPLELQKVMDTGDWSRSSIKPKKSCNKCYGRGYVGKDAKHNIYLPCNCILNQISKKTGSWSGITGGRDKNFVR